MLELMRNGLKGWFGKSLIILFVAPFLFLGAESFFTVFTTTDSAIEVNGEKISEQQIVNAVENNKEQIRQRFGAEFDMSIFSDQALREGASGQLIESELLAQYAERNNLNVSFKKLSEIIREFPVFYGTDGQFSQEVFETIAAQQGINTKKLLGLIKDDVSVSQVQQAVASSAFSLKHEVEHIELLKRQKRDFAYLTLKLEDFKKDVEIDEGEAKIYYDNNLDSFMSTELIKIEYLELKVNDLLDKVTLNEEEVQARFDSEQLALTNNANRRASHILISIDEDRDEEAAFELISEVAEKLESGLEFKELAMQFSNDPGSAKQGGDLGFAGRGSYVPEFEEALYGLEVGEISEPVLTEFGYHIIKLTELGDVETLSLKAEKERIENTLKREKAFDLYQQKFSELEELVFESANLDEPASVMGMEIKVSKGFQRGLGEGIASSQEIRDLAYSDSILKDGENSSVVELDDGHAIVLRLSQYFPSETKSFQDVSDEIITVLKTDKAQAALAIKQSEIMEMLNAGESAHSVAMSVGQDWQIESEVGRRKVGVPPEVLNKAFEMPIPKEGERTISTVDLNESDLALITLTKVHNSEEVFTEKELYNFTRQDQFAKANSDWRAYLDYMKSQADIRYFSTKEFSGESAL